MSQLIISRSSDLRRGIRKSTLPFQFEMGPSMLMFILIVFLAVTSLITLMHSTKEVTKGFVVSSLEAQRSSLVKDYEVKTMQLAEITSLNSIQNTDKFQRMVKPRSVTYVKGDSGLASR